MLTLTIAPNYALIEEVDLSFSEHFLDVFNPYGFAALHTSSYNTCEKIGVGAQLVYLCDIMNFRDLAMYVPFMTK